MSVIQHQLARQVLKLIRDGNATHRLLTYQSAAIALGRTADSARAIAQVCDLIDAATALANIPLLALVAVRATSGEINPKAWVKDTPEWVRDAVIERSRAYSFTEDDFAAIEKSLDRLSGYGNKTAWQEVKRLIPNLYEQITTPVVHKTENIEVDDFVAFVKTMQGKVIHTRKQSKGFTVEVTDKGFEFTPTATNKQRPHEFQAIMRVVERFNKTRTFTTSSYTDITYNSSYTLTLIGLYLDHAPTADSDELDQRVRNLRKKMSTTDCPEGQQQPQKIATTTSSYTRDPFVKAWVLENAKGSCESCGSPAPFLTSYDEPFLEVHHVVLLAEGGSDTIFNTIAVCPNCHRRYHYSKDKKSDLLGLYTRITRLKRK